MIIKSQFKDYYDHQAHIWGGGDPSITYARHRLVPQQMLNGYLTAGFLTMKVFNVPSFPDVVYRRQSGFNPFGGYGFKWLAVIGKLYLLVQRTPEEAFKIINRTDHATLLEKIETTKFYWRKQKTIDDYLGIELDSILELTKKLNAPVFTLHDMLISKHNHYVIDGEIPILGDVGFAALVPPDQMYQNLSYFIGNVMKDSPDLSPPTNMTNKEKIVQHGFDVVQSFRHRTK